MADVLALVDGQPWRFRDDFPEWFRRNQHIWNRFHAEANKVYALGRRHYSARTIGEYLRHETALTSVADGEWKLNNNRFPDLARAYLMLYPERDGFFDLRETEERRKPRDLFGARIALVGV